MAVVNGSLFFLERCLEVVEDVLRDDVNSGVDQGRYVRRRFLNVMSHGVGGLVFNDTPIVQRLLTGRLCRHDGQGRLGVSVRPHHLLQWEITGKEASILTGMKFYT